MKRRRNQSWKMTLTTIGLLALGTATLSGCKSQRYNGDDKRTGQGQGIRSGSSSPQYGSVPAFTLTNQDGKSFGSNELTGKVYVTSFFFTSCVTICPKILGAMATLQDRFKTAGLDVRLLSITVDPDTDTPKRLRTHALKAGADFSRWTFLTGTRKKIRDLIYSGFKTHIGDPQRIADPRGGPDDILEIGHGARLVLVDGNSKVHGHFESTPLGQEELIRRAKSLLRK